MKIRMKSNVLEVMRNVIKLVHTYNFLIQFLIRTIFSEPYYDPDVFSKLITNTMNPVGLDQSNLPLP